MAVSESNRNDSQKLTFAFLATDVPQIRIIFDCLISSSFFN
jgi:hypothetical protein